MTKVRYAIAATLFLITAAVVIRSRWSAADLAWGSWISGVVVGTGLVLVSLGSFVLIRSANLRLGCLIMVLAFFCPLWVGLQIGLAGILHEAFPLARGKFDLTVILRTALVSYWVLILMP